MSEPHAVLNGLAFDEARSLLARCCGSSRWVEGMLQRRPFASTAVLYADAEAVWGTLTEADFLEAFAHHPRIGARAGDQWARQEQARVDEADAETERELRAGNEQYLRRFGYIFIVCATGRSPTEMLSALQARLGNDPGDELAVAAGEQARITRLRLEKLSPAK